MGTCTTKPKIMYVVRENSRDVLCTYDLTVAQSLFEDPWAYELELFAYYPDQFGKTSVRMIPQPVYVFERRQNNYVDNRAHPVGSR